MVIVSKQDEKAPILSKKLSELVIDELELHVEDEQGAIEEKAKIETTILDCTTPTAKEHQIPDLMTCPPAPRKRKVPLAVKGNASNKVRDVKEFFASPDLEAVLGINKVSSRISWTTRRSDR